MNAPPVPWRLTRNAARNARVLRLSLGLSQAKTAAGAGIAPASLSGFEGGGMRLSRARLEGLAAVLGTTAETLGADECAACGQASGHGHGCGGAA